MAVRLGTEAEVIVHPAIAGVDINEELAAAFAAATAGADIDEEVAAANAAAIAAETNPHAEFDSFMAGEFTLISPKITPAGQTAGSIKALIMSAVGELLSEQLNQLTEEQVKSLSMADMEKIVDAMRGVVTQ